MKTTAPAAEVGRVEVEIDRPSPRWPRFTVDPYVETIRNLRRGSDWGLIARMASDGYASLEQVLPAAAVRAVTAPSAQALRETPAELVSIAAGLENV